MTTNIDPLLHIDPTEFRTGIAYIKALVGEDPSIDLARYMRISHYHELNTKRGYSRCRFHAAVREWREVNGLPKRPSGRKGAFKAANWVPGEEAKKAPESAENGVNGAALYPDKGSTPKVVNSLDGAALAELVWEWMTKHDLEMVAFWDDGEVNVRRKEKKTREFRIVVDGEEA